MKAIVTHLAFGSSQLTNMFMAECKNLLLSEAETYPQPDVDAILEILLHLPPSLMCFKHGAQN